MIRILSETAGLYLHPTPKRMLYVLVSEEPKLWFPADCPLLHTPGLLGRLRHTYAAAVPT
jgi:hypothetical protein